MRLRRSAPWIALALLAGGLSVLAGQATQPAEDDPVFSVIVPVGRVGDRWEAEGRWEETVPSEDGPETRNGTYRLAAELGRPMEILNRQGQKRAVVPVYEHYDGDVPSDGATRQVRYVDLASRSVIRIDHLVKGTVNDPPPLGYAMNGPRDEVTTFYPEPERVSWAVHQGQTVEVGSADWLRAAPFLDCEAPWGVTSGSHIEPARGGLMGGKPVILLESEANRTLTKRTGWEKEHVNWTVWLSSDSPFVVEERRNVTVEGPTGRSVRHLWQWQVTYQPGSEPIAWAQPEQAPCDVRDVLQPQRSGVEANHPADGTGRLLPYPLAKAKQAVENDPQLIGFARWRSQNPDHGLAAALYRVASFDNSGRATVQYDWFLLYAAGTNAVTVKSFYAPAVPVPRNEDARSVTLAPNESYERSKLPVNPVTIAHALEQWYSLAPEVLTAPEGPAAVGWGVTRVFSVESVGYQSISVMERRSLNRTVSQNAEVFRLVVDAESGQLKLSTSSTLSRSFQPPGVLDGAQPVTPLVVVGPAPQGSLALSRSAAAVAAVALIIAVLRWLLHGNAVVPSYAKLAKARVLGHELRDQLVRRIRAQPGLSIRDLWREVDAGWSTVVYHLFVLERNGIVASIRDGPRRRFFPVGDIDASARIAHAVLRNPKTNAILETVRRASDQNQVALARAASTTPQAVAWHLRRLEEAGLVRSRRVGRETRYGVVERSSTAAGETPGASADPS